MSAQPANGQKSPSDLKECVSRRVKALHGLPTTVGVAVRLFGLPKGEGADVNEYVRVISSDAGLTARILALANSPLFGLRVRITQPQVAINLLGIPAVRTLAINFCLSGLHHELRLRKEESQRLWEASMCKAVAARQLALHLDEKVADDAYIAGLMQDMALPVMFACARENMGNLLESRIAISIRLQKERELFTADHAELGALVARRLELPENQAAMVAVHHDLPALEETLGASLRPLARSAFAASLFPHRLDHWDSADIEALRAFLQSDKGGNLELEPFVDTVSAECRQQFSYFDGSNVTEIKLLELLATATQEAAEETVRLVTTVREMKTYVDSADQAVVRMAEEVSRDVVTGALTRAAFERECQRSLQQMQRERQPVAMIYLDADNFKEVNDQCGHAAGDEALRMIVSVVRDCIRATDLIGRLGGDEFAVLLPNCPEAKARAIAERIRKEVAGRSVQGCGASRPLSVSIGLIWTASNKTASLESLIADSDRRMYAAKRSGGNKVSTAAQAVTS
jgi:diguanylate cyclase (GGDEF)-like protein